MEDPDFFKRIRQRLNSYSPRKCRCDDSRKQNANEKVSHLEQPTTAPTELQDNDQKVLDESDGQLRTTSTSTSDEPKQPSGSKSEPETAKNNDNVIRYENQIRANDVHQSVLTNLERQAFCQCNQSVVHELCIHTTAPNYSVANDHVVELFLIAIAPTLRSLPLCLLNIVKSRIFSIVQEAEMELLHSKLVKKEHDHH